MTKPTQVLRGWIDKPLAGLNNFIFYTEHPFRGYRVFPDLRLILKASALFERGGVELVLVGFVDPNDRLVFHAIDAWRVSNVTKK